MACLGMCFYPSCWRFFGLKPVNWWVALILFWSLPPPCSLSSLDFSSVLTRFRPSHSLHVSASSQIFRLLTALGHFLENFISHVFQLTHSLFRWSNLLVGLSIELLLSRIVFFYFYKFCLFVFRSSTSFYSFLFLAYVFSLSFVSLNIEKIVVLYCAW